MPPDRHAKVLPARNLLRAAGMADSAVNVDRLSRMVGVRRISSVPTRDMEACLVPDNYGYTILVNQRLPADQRRFCIAHEIGHILLRARCMKYRGARRSQEEQRCDLLADEILMPESRFSREMAECEPSLSWIESLAARYEVPVEAAARRFGNCARTDLQIVCWGREGADLAPRWTSGKPLLTGRLRPKRVSPHDFSHHVVRTFTSGRLAVDGYLSKNFGPLRIESRRFGLALTPNVLTLIYPITNHQPPITLEGTEDK
jgi:Predicted Zn peptidase